MIVKNDHKIKDFWNNYAIWKIITVLIYSFECQIAVIVGTHGQKCETVTLLFIYSKALFE